MYRFFLQAILVLFVAFSHFGLCYGQETETFNFVDWTFDGASDWKASYAEHSVKGTAATVSFASATKSSSKNGVTDCPVVKDKNPVTVTLNNNGYTIIGVDINLKQWGSYTQTVTLHTSTDGSTFVETSISSSDFHLSASNLTAKAVKFTFSNNYQVGIQSIAITYAKASISTTEATFDFSSPSSYGYTLPDEDTYIEIGAGKAISSNDVSITNTSDGATTTRFYKQSSGTVLRAYKNAVLTVSAPTDYVLTYVEAEAATFNAAIGNGEAGDKEWTGAKTEVPITFTGQTNLSKLTVRYQKIDQEIKEKEANTFADGTYAVVKLERTLSSNFWNTFCPPFDISEDKVIATLGADAQIMEYAGDEGEKMYFSAVKEMKAGVAYLVRPAQTVTDPIFYGVDTQAGVTVASSKGTKYQFIGVLNSKALDVTTDLGITTSGKVSKIKADANTIRGMRAYIHIADGTSVSDAAKSLKLSLDEETTAITPSPASPQALSSRKVYNLQGVCMGESTDGLPKGIYIIDGKKLMK